MRSHVLLAFAALAAVRCNGTETDNPAEPDSPLVAFEGSDCKSVPKATDPARWPDAGSIGQVTAPLELSGARGLTCRDWTRSEDGSLRYELVNLQEGCGINWSGARARVEGSEIFLEGINPECLLAACGSCLYDLHFEVDGVPPEGDLTVHFTVTDEDGTPCDADGGRGFTIPADAPSDTDCNFLRSYGLAAPEYCTLHMACGDGRPCSCPTGQVCTEVQSINDERCLAECTTSADCPIPAAFDCVDGVCLPAE